MKWNIPYLKKESTKEKGDVIICILRGTLSPGIPTGSLSTQHAGIKLGYDPTFVTSLPLTLHQGDFILP